MYIQGALVQFSTPHTIRGRVNAVNMLFIGSSNELGEFRAGITQAFCLRETRCIIIMQTPPLLVSVQ